MRDKRRVCTIILDLYRVTLGKQVVLSFWRLLRCALTTLIRSDSDAGFWRLRCLSFTCSDTWLAMMHACLIHMPVLISAVGNRSYVFLTIFYDAPLSESL